MEEMMSIGVHNMIGGSPDPGRMSQQTLHFGKDFFLTPDISGILTERGTKEGNGGADTVTDCPFGTPGCSSRGF